MAEYMGERREYVINADLPVMIREQYTVEANSVEEAIEKIAEGEESDREFVDEVEIIGEHENFDVLQVRTYKIP